MLNLLNFIINYIILKEIYIYTYNKANKWSKYVICLINFVLQ